MKQLEASIKSKRHFYLFFILSCYFIYPIEGQANYWVDMIEGQVFVSKEDKIWLARKKDILPDQALISTENQAMTVLSDAYDHKYHLPGGSVIQLLNKLVELKDGKIRIISRNKKERFEIQTANGIVRFEETDAIISFDSTTGKTQVLVLSGSVRFSHLRHPDNYFLVETGHFSLIENGKYNNLPRKPTPIGHESFQKILVIFNERVPGIYTPVSKERSLASLQQDYNPNQRNKMPGEIIFVGKNQEKKKKERKNFTLDSFLQEKLTEIKRRKLQNKIPLFKRKTGVNLKIYGLPPKVRVKKNLAPQNLSPSAHLQKKRVQSQSFKSFLGKNENKGFKNDLDKQYLSQMRHEKEVNELINELKSFSQDYQKPH